MKRVKNDESFVLSTLNSEGKLDRFFDGLVHPGPNVALTP
jgi:hypothetical protein